MLRPPRFETQLAMLRAALSSASKQAPPTLPQLQEWVARMNGYRSYRQFQAEHRQDRKSAVPASTPVRRYYEVYLPDIVGAYEVPETLPEWRWIDREARFTHVGNNFEPGVWEFLVPVHEDPACAPADVPERLRAVFARARAAGCTWVLFHQG